VEFDSWIELAREQMAPLGEFLAGNMRGAWDLVNSLMTAGLATVARIVDSSVKCPVLGTVAA
jgi:hypothetical protein